MRRGTFRAIRDTGFAIDYAIELRTSLTDEHSVGVGQGSDWHNGVFLSKLSRIMPRID